MDFLFLKNTTYDYNFVFLEQIFPKKKLCGSESNSDCPNKSKRDSMNCYVLVRALVLLFIKLDATSKCGGDSKTLIKFVG